MIYHKYNFTDTYLNASGNKRTKMVLGELGKIIRNHKDAVIGAIEDAGITINNNANRREIIKTILNNRRNMRLMNNLSALIVASSSFDGGYADFLSENTPTLSAPPLSTETLKGAGVNTSKEPIGSDKTGWMSKIGEWFKAGKEKRQKKQAEAKAQGKPTFWQRIGGFFNKNKENIGAVAGTIYGGLQNTKQADAIMQQQLIQQQEQQERLDKQRRMLLIGAVVLIGGYFAYKYLYKKK